MGPAADADFSDALSSGQLKSKLWLVKSLIEANKLVLASTNGQQKLQLGTIFLCGGWYGTLADMLFKTELKIDKIRSFDIDESCWGIAEDFNRVWVDKKWQFKASALNIHSFNWTDSPAPSDGTIGNFYYNTIASNKIVKMKDRPDTFINTSCEHIHNFKDWYGKIPKGKLVVMQSNNYDQLEEHVNCAKDLEEFETQTPMTKCLYNGTLDLIKYTRYMRIGIR